MLLEHEVRSDGASISVSIASSGRIPIAAPAPAAASPLKQRSNKR